MSLLLMKIGGVSVVVFLAGWALRNWIAAQASRAVSHLFDQRLESHKARLKTESDLAVEHVRSTLRFEADHKLEELRAALGREGSRQLAVHGELIRRRFDAIEAVHSALLALYEAVRQLVDPTARNGGDTDEDCSTRVWDTFQCFDQSHREKRIFLSKATADHIAALRQQLVSNANLYQLQVKSPNNQNPYESWIKVHESVSQDIKQSIDELEAELRTLMGDAVTLKAK
ncbi:hypothetical protein [Burkholderia sp. 572]|uniref:hypothetical protein n=1 Tax=Burkholderia sp. 572 TaxID=3156414 RepID=UPI003395C6E6